MASYSGMSTIVVTPPATAALVAVQYPSHSVRPGSFTCTWESTKPGMITRFPTSRTCDRTGYHCHVQQIQTLLCSLPWNASDTNVAHSCTFIMSYVLLKRNTVTAISINLVAILWTFCIAFLWWNTFSFLEKGIEFSLSKNTMYSINILSRKSNINPAVFFYSSVYGFP